MADITKCQDADCPKKDTCYRWTAPADEYLQSYFAQSPRVGAMCFYHWRMDEWKPGRLRPVTDRLERDADGMPVRFYPETRKD